MAARKASGPACDCGQVVFDLAGKKPGALLRCPWCQQRYRLEDDGTVTPVSSRSRKAPTGLDEAEEGSSSSSRRRGVRMREGAEEADEPTAERAPVRPSSRSKGPAIGRRERPDEVLEEGDGVEVFRFDAAEEEEGEGSPSADRPRGSRRRNIAGDSTEPLERISRRRTRKLEPVEEAGAGEGEVADESLPPLKPIDLEKWVVRMFLGLIPTGTLFFMGYVIYGVYKGERDFVTYKILGLTIRGDNPWVWFAGVVLGSLVFLGLWVGYVYFFVHKKKLAEKDEERRLRESGRSSSRRGVRNSRRVDDER